MRLTTAQRELLAELPAPVADHYPPAKALVRLGLAYWGEGVRDGTLFPATPPQFSPAESETQ